MVDVSKLQCGYSWKLIGSRVLLLFVGGGISAGMGCGTGDDETAGGFGSSESGEWDAASAGGDGQSTVDSLTGAGDSGGADTSVDSNQDGESDSGMDSGDEDQGSGDEADSGEPTGEEPDTGNDSSEPMTGGMGDAGGNEGGDTGEPEPPDPTDEAAENWRGRYNPDSFAGPCSPSVQVTNDEPGGRGKIFTDLFPDPAGMVVKHARIVCSILYRDTGEVPSFSSVTLKLSSSYNGVAQAGGMPAFPPWVPEGTGNIEVSLGWLQDISGRSEEQKRFEIEGVFVHEITHIYQTAVVIGEGLPPDIQMHPTGIIEGIADFVRMHGDRVQAYRPTKGGHWNGGYMETAYFLDWLDRMYPDIVYRFNKRMKNEVFTDGTYQAETGRAVGDLWGQYQGEL